MTTVTLSIASREAVTRRFLNAAAGHAEGHFISFETPSLLFGTLTAKRWDLLAAMQGAGPLAASDLACRVGRARSRECRPTCGRCSMPGSSRRRLKVSSSFRTTPCTSIFHYVRRDRGLPATAPFGKRLQPRWQSRLKALLPRIASAPPTSSARPGTSGFSRDSRW